MELTTAGSVAQQVQYATILKNDKKLIEELTF